MPPILEHGRQRAGEDEEEAEYPEDVTIEQVLITDVGHSRKRAPIPLPDDCTN